MATNTPARPFRAVFTALLMAATFLPFLQTPTVLAQSGCSAKPPTDGRMPRPSHIAVENHDGQTFVTWKDAADGATAIRYRYSLYRSTEPITERSLGSAKLIAQGIPYNSAKLYGRDFAPADRLDPRQPTAKARDGGAPLPLWSGLAVYTAKASETAYYAVVVTDVGLHRLGKIEPGVNATTTGIREQVAPQQPILMYASRDRRDSSASSVALGETGLPLMLQLHASESRGGAARPFGDYYVYFGNENMGYRDGLPSVFSVAPAVWVPGHMLELFPRDAVLDPDAAKAIETDWFGYYCRPQWARAGAPPLAYPFTENRLLWMLNWTIQRYRIDPDKVYSSGYSMGGWGTMSFAFRHPEIFAAVFPEMPRMRQRSLPSLAGPVPADPKLPDGRNYYTRMDMVQFVQTHPGDLPFIGWSIGRHDGYASWKEQVDMVHALEVGHRGFAFAWNDGGHSDGPSPMRTIWKYYPPEKFSRHTSYPAFSKSSIDSKLGDGNPESGDKVGGINLGFGWSTPIETPTTWSVSISNALASEPMTVDVTPRRVQKFKLAAESPIKWRTTADQSGTVVADKTGIVTIPHVKIIPGKKTILKLSME